ncbi:MAG: peptidase M23, partial [Gammaproteobacteria bacterium]
MRTLRQQGRRVRQRIDELQTRQREQAATLRRQRQLLAQQVRAAYVMGRQERLRLVLDQDDPGEISRLLTYYD